MLAEVVTILIVLAIIGAIIKALDKLRYGEEIGEIK